MNTIRQPYEFLVRWDRAGTLAGAQVQFRYLTTADDGSVVGEFVGAAETVAVGGTAGFPLTDILNAVQVAALTDRDALATELDALKARMSAGNTIV